MSEDEPPGTSVDRQAAGGTGTGDDDRDASASGSGIMPPGQSALERSGLWGFFSFNWTYGMIRKGWNGVLQDPDAEYLMPQSDTAETLAAEFAQAHAAVKVGCGSLAHVKACA